MLWVGNNKKELKSLALARLEGRSLSTKQGRPVNKKSDKYAILTRKGSLARLKGGVLAPVTSDTKLPVLCTQPAVPRQEYFASLIEQMRTFGYKVTEAIDRSGRKRAFTVIRGLHLFTIDSRFDAGTKKLHEACAAEVNIVAVPGRKKLEFGKENLPDCTKDPYYRQARRQFVFDVMTATNKTIEKTAGHNDFWADGFPTRTCADMPRVALGYTQNGLVDVPNIARLFVACTFGCTLLQLQESKRNCCICLVRQYRQIWKTNVRMLEIFLCIPSCISDDVTYQQRRQTSTNGISTDTGKKTITQSVTEAYTMLAKNRSYRKLLILLLDQVPSDASAASKKLTELKVGQYFCVEPCNRPYCGRFETVERRRGLDILLCFIGSDG
ncbi:unnamed protein product [Haemonchus placei]|uniref:40S ribosomal protein S6 n=1 Tax=Haemonchus placei TaxID=6290 RepID=A0A0N4WG15_HAEPC|nr:unnamed protein product [Haemonchus placei]